MKVAAGDRVSFEFVQQADGNFQVTAMAPALPAPSHQHGERK
jgi:Cu(I)/Ag(I) efflux system membrane fusion protein